MKVSRRQFVIDSAAIALTSITALYARRKTLRILIVDGVNNHDWRSATARLREILLQTGRFQVDVSTTPSRESLPAEWPQRTPVDRDSAATFAPQSTKTAANRLRC